MSYLKIQLTDSFAKAYPNLKSFQINKCVDDYYSLVMQHIFNQKYQYPNKSYSDDEFIFEQTKIRKEIGKVTIDKKQFWVYHLMQKNPRTSLITVTFEGVKGKNSRVTLNPIYKEQIMNELGDLKIEANYDKLQELELSSNNDVIVIPKSLLSFIEQSQRNLGTAGSQNLKDKILKDITVAKTLMTMIKSIEADNGEVCYLAETWKEADTGRLYGQGLSLQRCSQEVRHGALGICHKYDFKASSFALMAGLAEAIDPTIHIQSILEYVKNRTVIRKKLAKMTGTSEKNIKMVFNAMGFGAKVSNSLKTSIRSAIPNEEAFKKLLSCQEFAYIYEDLEKIREVILNYSGFEGSFEFFGKTYNEFDELGQKKTSSQKLAFIYQTMEAYAMKKFCSLSGQTHLLTTHDCIYYEQKLPNEKLLDITYQLDLEFPYLRFEHEKIIPIHTSEDHQKLFKDNLDFEEEHKNFIYQETISSKEYTSPLQSTIIVTPRTNVFDLEEYERTHSDIADYEYEYEYDMNENTTNKY